MKNMQDLTVQTLLAVSTSMMNVNSYKTIMNNSYAVLVLLYFCDFASQYI